MTGNNSFKTFCRAAVVSLGLIPAFAFAASDGSLGAQSTGTINVGVFVNAEVKISGLQDMTHDWDGNATTFESSPFCVYTSTSGSLYTLTLTGTANANNFTLVNPNDPTHPVSYQVQVNDGSNGYKSMAAGTESFGLHGSSALDCNGNPNTQIKVLVSQANGASGVYSGTINFQVTPQ